MIIKRLSDLASGVIPLFRNKISANNLVNTSGDKAKIPKLKALVLSTTLIND